MRASHPIASSMLLLAAAVLLSLTGGCGDDSSTGPSSGETWRMETLTVATAILGPGDSTLVRARVVLDDGVTGAAGKQVLFGEMLDRESGTFAPQAATTDASGWAEALYRADRGYWGLVTLKARSGESTSYVQLLLQASQAGSDVLTISSPSNATAIPADGTSLLSLQVHVTRGLDGEPLANATVRLAAGDRFVDNDRDGAFTSGDQLLQGGDLNQNGSWDPLGTVPAAVVTDGSGTAEFTIRAASTPGTTWVHASSDDGETDFAIVFHPTTLLLEVHAVESEMMADGLRESEVYAIVTDWEGRPVQGVVVQFTAGEPFEDLDGDGQYTDPTDIFSDTNGNGRWDVMGAIGSHATTQHDGTATVLYRAGVDPGDVTIQARTRGVEAQAIVHLLRMPSAYRMSLEAEGGPIYADGTSRAPVSIQVWDVNQTALPGKRILLAAGEPFDDVDGNGVWTPGVDRLRRDQNGDRTWNAIGSVPASVVTGDGGRAYVDLVSGMEPGETTLKATVDGVSEEITIQLLSLPPVTRLDLVTDNESIRTRGSGGDDAATLTATCFDALGARVPAGLTVRFTIASGPDEGETILGGQEGVFTTQTNADGEAIAVLQAGTAPGLVQVLAEAGAAQRTITVQIASGPPAGLFCEANPEEIDTEGTSEILVHLYDERHNPVDGAWVRFESDWGIIEGMDGPATSISSNGVARALFQCPVARPGDDGIARITCHAEGTDLSCIALVRIPTSPVSIAGLTLTSPATRLVVKDAGGTDETTLEVIAIDAQGRPCGAGFPIEVSIVSGPNGGEGIEGAGTREVTRTTGSDGKVLVPLLTGTLPGPMTLVARYGVMESNRRNFLIAPGPAEDLTVWATDATVALDDTTTVHFRVLDRYRNPVADSTVVRVSVDEGRITGTAYPGALYSRTEGGRASAVYAASGLLPGGDGIAVVGCEVDAQHGSCVIGIPNTASDPAAIALDAAEPEIEVYGAGGVEQTILTATVTNASGDLVGEGARVTFRIVGGPGGGERFENGAAVITAPTFRSGTASAVLTAGTLTGTVRITAEAGSVVSEAVGVNVASGPPADLQCGGPAQLVCGGGMVSDESTVAFVTDAYGNAVKDGTVVSVSASPGGLVTGIDGRNGTLVTKDGVAPYVFYPPLGNDCPSMPVVTLTFTVQGIEPCSWPITITLP